MPIKRKTDVLDSMKLETFDKKIKNDSETIDSLLDLHSIDSCNKTLKFDNKLVDIGNTTTKYVYTNTSQLSLKSKLKNKDYLKLAPIFDNNLFLKNKVEILNEQINEIEYAPRLENLGNSCYLNAVVYALFATPIFVQHICELNLNINETIAQMSTLSSLNNSTIQLPDPLPKSWKLIRNLNEIFFKMQKSLIEKISPIKPNDLLNTLSQQNENFILNQQQDAHELLRFILETLQEAIFELNQIRSMIESFVITSLKNIENKIQKDISDKVNINNQRQKKNGEQNENCSRNKNLVENVEVKQSLGSKTSLISCFFKKTKPSTFDILKSVNCNQVANFISNSFVGFVSNNICCLECETISSTKQEFLDFGIDVAQKSKLYNSTFIDSDDEDIKNKSFKRCSIDSEEWIKTNLQDVEIIGKENKFFCSICNQYNEAEKCSRITHNPPIFIVNLKRFVSFSSFSGCYTKCLEYFNIPLTMNCIEYNCSDLTHRYKLFAIISHAGFTITSGHYTAFVKVSNYQKNLKNYCQKNIFIENKINIIEEKKTEFIENLVLVSNSHLENANLNINNTNNTSKNKNDIEICNNFKENKIYTVGENEKLIEASNLQSNDKDRFDIEMCANFNDLNDDSWWFYDDDRVSLMSSEQLSNQLTKKSSDTPYILFYQMI